VGRLADFPKHRLKWGILATQTPKQKLRQLADTPRDNK